MAQFQCAGGKRRGLPRHRPKVANPVTGPVFIKNANAGNVPKVTVLKSKLSGKALRLSPGPVGDIVGRGHQEHGENRRDQE